MTKKVVSLPLNLYVSSQVSSQFHPSILTLFLVCTSFYQFLPGFSTPNLKILPTCSFVSIQLQIIFKNLIFYRWCYLAISYLCRLNPNTLKVLCRFQCNQYISHVLITYFFNSCTTSFSGYPSGFPQVFLKLPKLSESFPERVVLVPRYWSFKSFP